MRALTVLLLLISIAGLIGIVALFPSFIKAYSEESEALNKVSSINIKNSNENSDSLQSEIVFSKKLLSYLHKEDREQNSSNIINSLIGMRDSLKLTSISLTKVSTSTVSIILQGIAPTRNSLLDFKKQFEANKPGNIVDLPVAQLSKSSNIQFSLKLTQQIL